MKALTALTLFIVLCFSGQSFAQKKVEVKYERVTYPKDNLPKMYYKLFASKGLSVSRLDSVGQIEESALERNENGVFTYTLKAPKPPVRDDLYIDVNKSTIRMVSTIRGNTRQITDTPPSLDWHITDESKEIGEYIAIKAEVTFRGRDFEAWFTPEIPISAGPWKFYGLPGLILEVKDIEEDNQWYARNVKYPAEFDSEVLIVNPDDIDEEVSLQEGLKQHLESQKKEERLRQSRINQRNSQSEYKIISSELKYPGREKWLERVYEWE